ncbi:Helicase IV [compost metagenome]
MRQTTFQEYLEHRIGREFQLEDPFEQLEYVLSRYDEEGFEARIEGIRYKSSHQYYKAINNYKDKLEQDLMRFKPLRFQGQEIVGASAIHNRFYAFDRSVRLANRCELLKEWLLKELAAFAKNELDKPWVEEQIQLLETEEYQRAYQRLRRNNRRKSESFSDYEDEKMILAKMVVSSRLKPLRKWVKAMRFIDNKQLYAQLFELPELMQELNEGTLPEHWSEISSFTLNKLKKTELAYEDATPMLYLKELILGFHSNTSIRHVFIDEAQDYSPFQLYFLKRLFPRARMTALGDLNQAIYAHASVLQQSSVLADLYGEEESEQIVLTRSYRSTKQIVEFTKGMIPGGERIQAFNRSGELPEVHKVADRNELHQAVISDIETLRAGGYETIAVICKTAAESLDAYNVLQEIPSVKLIKKTTLNFERGIHVIPAYLAKGVEFDAVLIYDGSEAAYARETERKLFYTACTRAMHLLHIYSVGELSPFITGASPDTYLSLS